MAETTAKEQYRLYLEGRLDKLTNDLSVLKEKLDTFAATDAGVMRQRLAALDVSIEQLQLVEIRERENYVRAFVVSLKREVEVVLRDAGILPEGECLKTRLGDSHPGADAGLDNQSSRGRFLETLAEDKRESAKADGERVAQ